jgi:hypothetical protein
MIGISDSSVTLPRLFTICSLNTCEGEERQRQSSTVRLPSHPRPLQS